MPRRCAADGCFVVPVFGPPGDGLKNTHASHCAKHRPDGYQDVRNRRCAADGCLKRASFGTPGAGATHCGAHRLAGQMNTKNRSCLAPGCPKQPNYGPPGIGSAGALYCAEHRLDWHRDVKNRRCAAAGCEARALYGVPGLPHSGRGRPTRPGYGPATHCARHRPEGSFDCHNKLCAADGCRRKPSYGMPLLDASLVGLDARLAGLDASLDGSDASLDGSDARLVGTDARLDGSDARLDGSDARLERVKATHCARHRLEGSMRTVAEGTGRATRPRAARLCAAAGCAQHAIFGQPDSKAAGARYCADHRLEGWWDARIRRCDAADCLKNPSFGTETTGARYCADHRPDGTWDVKNRRCVAAGCLKHPTFGLAGGALADGALAGGALVGGALVGGALAGGARALATHCLEHRPEGYLDVTHKRCAASLSGCAGRQARGSEFCAMHRRALQPEPPLPGIQALSELLGPIDQELLEGSHLIAIDSGPQAGPMLAERRRHRTQPY